MSIGCQVVSFPSIDASPLLKRSGTLPWVEIDHLTVNNQIESKSHER